jgi:hypothetical protein
LQAVGRLERWGGSWLVQKMFASEHAILPGNEHASLSGES